jgi:transcriptional regulator with XRE-family HTH domain
MGGRRRFRPSLDAELGQDRRDVVPGGPRGDEQLMLEADAAITYVLSSGSMDAGRTVRYARRRAGLTQRALAARAGVPQPAVARIERGAVTPRIDTVMELLEAAGFTLEVSPVIGEGVDRTLLRAALTRSPEDRVRAAASNARNLRTYLDAVGDPAR